MPDPFDWAVRFETEAKAMMLAGEYKPLIDYETLGPEALLSIPIPDHYLPLLYVIATRQRSEVVTFPIEGADGGSAVLKEALDKGHTVTAIVRYPEKLEKRERLVAKAAGFRSRIMQSP